MRALLNPIDVRIQMVDYVHPHSSDPVRYIPPWYHWKERNSNLSLPEPIRSEISQFLSLKIFSSVRGDCGQALAPLAD